MNAVKIRYDQGLEEIVNADRLVKYRPRVLTPLKDWKKFKEFSPKINVPTPISPSTQGSQLQDDETRDLFGNAALERKQAQHFTTLVS